MIGFGLEYPAYWAARKPRYAWLLLTFILVGAFISLPSITFDDDFLRGFHSQSQRSQDFKDLHDDLDIQTRGIIVLVTTDDWFSPSELRSIREIHFELLLLDDVQFVASPISMKFPPKHHQFPDEYVFPDGVQESGIRERMDYYLSSSDQLPNYLSSDFMAARMIVYFRSGGDQQTLIRDQLDQVRNIVSAAGNDNLEFRLTGEDVLAVAIVDAIKRDQIILNGLGGILAFFVAFAVFRNIRVTLVAMIPPGMAVLVTLGVFGASGVPVTVLSNVIPVLVLMLGLSNTMHLVCHFLRQPISKPFDERLEKTIAEIGPACALTVITTAIAFAAIAVSSNQLLREFAVVGAAGLVISFLVLIVAFPLLAQIVLSKPSSNHQLGNAIKFVRVPEFASRILTSRPLFVIAVGVILIVTAGVGARYTVPWFSIYQNLPINSETRQASLVLDQKFGGFFALWTEFDFTDEGGIATPNGWAKLANIHSGLEPAIAGRESFSLHTLATLLGQPEAAPRKADFSELPPQIFDNLAPPNSNIVRILIVTGDPMRDEESLAAYDRLEKSAADLGSVRITGMSTLLRHESVSIVTQLYVGLIIACMLSVAVIALGFRQLALLAILPIPNFLPLLVSASALLLIDSGRMTPAAVIALIVAFGIAVDDSIHFVARFQHNIALGKPQREAAQSAISEVGGVMMLTTMLISVGLTVTSFSSFETIQLFGMMMVTTLVTALIADLALLPALLSLRRLRDVRIK